MQVQIMKSTESNLKQLKDFIINCTTATASLNNYTDFKRINECLHKLFPQYDELLEINSAEEVSNVLKRLKNDEDFKEYERSVNGQYSSCINNYIRFLKARQLFSSKTTNECSLKKSDKDILQAIYYGCPGTGKSHAIKEITKEESFVRTTFHPDSDYSTFVGCYKPTMNEDRIVYEFVEQAFIKAYVKAWQFYFESTDRENIKKQFLIIEEINRGNCAQIFGDLFQLLDRNDYGFSDYYIHADNDLQKHLEKYFKKAFKDIETNNLFIKEEINSMYCEDVVGKVLKGEILLLPSNLYIWATMNTSDQSLFPIDSAFKRRWNWKYQPIVKGRDKDELIWEIEGETAYFDWWSFLKTINEKIGSNSFSEDKKLGFFFCKAIDNKISAETFVSKVVFYLWNDVFKNSGYEGEVFKDLNFDSFYTTNNKGEVVVDKSVLERFLVENIAITEATSTIEEDEDESDNNATFTVNDKEIKNKNAVVYTAIEEYVGLNQDKSAQEIIDVWKDFKKYSTRSWIICNKEEHDKMNPRYANYSYKIECGDGDSVWVNKDGWMYHPKNKNLKDSLSEFIKAVNEANLGIIIKETTA